MLFADHLGAGDYGVAAAVLVLVTLMAVALGALAVREQTWIGRAGLALLAAALAVAVVNGLADLEPLANALDRVTGSDPSFDRSSLWQVIDALYGHPIAIALALVALPLLVARPFVHARRRVSAVLDGAGRRDPAR